MAVAGSLLAALLAYPIFASGASVRRRAGSPISRPVADTSGRTQAWLAGFELFASSPVFGVGLGRWEERRSWTSWPTTGTSRFWLSLGLSGSYVDAVHWRDTGRAQSSVAAGSKRRLSVLVVWLAASLTLSPPTLYRMTGPVLIVVAAAGVADWARGRRPSAGTCWRQPRLQRAGIGHLVPDDCSATRDTGVDDCRPVTRFAEEPPCS